jgi:hypothetical protein
VSIKKKTVVAIAFGVLTGTFLPLAGEVNAQKKPPCGFNASALWCERQPYPEKPNIGNDIMQGLPRQNQVVPDLSQEIARCPNDLSDAAVFVHDSEENKTFEYGSISFADNNFGSSLLGENCYLQMDLDDGSKVQYFLISNGQALLLQSNQKIIDVVDQKIKIPILQWDTLQMSSGKVFRILINEKLSLLLRSN